MLQSRMPWMLFDRSEIHEMKEGTNRRVDGIVHLAPLLIYQLDCLDVRRRRARVLLKEHRRLDAARISLQDRRAVLQKRHEVRTDLQVITEQVELRKFFRGPVDAIETGK